jgi:[NiFe] hydrogenase diaphorase moiety large subunit
MTIQELLDLCGAKNTKAIQLNGPSGSLIPKEEFEYTYLVPWNYPMDKLQEVNGKKKDIIALGSTMIFDESVDIYDVVMNFNKFFIGESCGYCTPCRAGNYLMGERLKKIRKGVASTNELNDLEKCTKYVKLSSRCGLGETAPNNIIDALEKFRYIFTDKIHKKEQRLDLDEITAKHKEVVKKLKNRK